MDKKELQKVFEELINPITAVSSFILGEYHVNDEDTYIRVSFDFQREKYMVLVSCEKESERIELCMRHEAEPLEYLFGKDWRERLEKR